MEGRVKQELVNIYVVHAREQIPGTKLGPVDQDARTVLYDIDHSSACPRLSRGATLVESSRDESAAVA